MLDHVAIIENGRTFRRRAMIEKHRHHAEAFQAIEAVRRGEFQLHAQPIRPLNVPMDGPSWCEILIRPPYSTPQRLMLVAEAEGLAPEIDFAVWRRALPQLAHKDRFSLNLSGQTVSRAESLPRLLEMLQLTDVTPQQLVVEITETAAITDYRVAVQFAKTLRALGVRVALDDVKDASLAFPLAFTDYIKLDRDVVAGAADESRLRALCALAKSEGRQVIAEGVESAAELHRVALHGVHWYQGYFQNGCGTLLPARETASIASL